MTKQQQRRKAYDARNAQSDKNELSHLICEKYITQLKYQQAETVMWYLHCRSEVRTLDKVTVLLSESKRIVIPYCTTDDLGQKQLGLWWLQHLSELIPGTWGILEPPKNRWKERKKQVFPHELDMIMVPGVAFDLKGGRLGNGAGYYDRLLQLVRSDALLTAVCYESQIVDRVVMEPHDVLMHHLLTEKNNYTC